LQRLADAILRMSAGHVSLSAVKANVRLYVAGGGLLIYLDIEGVVYSNEHQRGLGREDVPLRGLVFLVLQQCLRVISVD
jgi:hypothetical protein